MVSGSFEDRETCLTRLEIGRYYTKRDVSNDSGSSRQVQRAQRFVGPGARQHRLSEHGHRLRCSPAPIMPPHCPEPRSAIWESQHRRPAIVQIGKGGVGHVAFGRAGECAVQPFSVMLHEASNLAPVLPVLYWPPPKTSFSTMARSSPDSVGAAPHSPLGRAGGFGGSNMLPAVGKGRRASMQADARHGEADEAKQGAGGQKQQATRLTSQRIDWTCWIGETAGGAGCRCSDAAQRRGR